MSRLVTASIVGAARWLQECPPSWREKAYADLKNQLARVWVERGPDEAVSLGSNFEAAVYRQASKSTFDAGTDHFRWFVKECAGGQFQRTFKRTVVIDDAEYCLYAKLDVWFPDVVKDVKTTKRWKGPEHYLSSFQHLLYLYLTGAADFRYLVAEFEDVKEHPRLLDHHQVDFNVDRDLDGQLMLEELVIAKVRSFVDFMKKDDELFELYVHKFSRFNDEKAKPKKEEVKKLMNLKLPTKAPAKVEAIVKPLSFVDEKREAEVTVDSLERLEELVKAFQRLAEELELLEAQVAEKKRAFNDVSQVEIPTLLRQHGLSEIRLKDKRKVIVREQVSVSVPDEKEKAFVEFLTKNDALDLVKLNLAFDRMPSSMRKALFAFVDVMEYPYSSHVGVHPQTLKAYFTRLFGIGERDQEEGIKEGAYKRPQDEDVKAAVNVYTFFTTTIKDK